MKTIAKVLEVMLTKPATPTWTVGMTSEPPMNPIPSNFGPLQQWGWGG